MRIAVVDDESMFCMQMQMLTDKISKKREISLQVDAFEDGNSFLEALTENRYDIVFMDIFMPDMDGIETATKLREMTARTFLIFMTSSEEHYPDAFALHAFDYVTKPFSLDRIENVIDEVIKHSPIDEAFIKISAGSRDIRIYLRDIVAVTTDSHYVEIHTESGEDYRARMTASGFIELSGDDKRFITINRGIIINMDFIENVTEDEVFMEDGQSYPIATKKSNAIIQQIDEYKFLHT